MTPLQVRKLGESIMQLTILNKKVPSRYFLQVSNYWIMENGSQNPTGEENQMGAAAVPLRS